MKRVIVLIIFFCIISISCARSTANKIEVSTPVKTQSYIGRFEDNVSLYRDSGNKLIVQKELEDGFELFSLNINEGILGFEYKVTPQDNLLYYKQLDAEKVLKVRQLGNSEEDNELLLVGKVTKNIAKKIGYSNAALVSTSPSQKYIVYCAVEDMQNQYSLHLYNIETNKTLILINSVDEVLLNDMQGNIAWSPNEAYLAVSNKQIFNVKNGKLISEVDAESVLWSTSGKKLAYIKSDKGYSKSISILDVNTAAVEEVFIVNSGEYLPGYILWNENETNLAFVTALIDKKEKENISPYKAIYSLDLRTKEAVRVDTALNMSEEQVSKLESMHYNQMGNILALIMADNWGSDLYVYNMSKSEWVFFLNIEYLHFENNEDYICSAGNKMYFVQDQDIVELDENMTSKRIHQSEDILEDIYVSKDGSSIIIVEKGKDIIVLRRLMNFAVKSM
jgi:WD40 repeat protein